MRWHIMQLEQDAIYGVQFGVLRTAADLAFGLIRISSCVVEFLLSWAPADFAFGLLRVCFWSLWTFALRSLRIFPSGLCEFYLWATANFYFRATVDFALGCHFVSSGPLRILLICCCGFCLGLLWTLFAFGLLFCLL